MQLSQTHPDALLSRAGNLVDRILSVTSASSGRDALDYLGSILPGFTFREGAENLRFEVRSAVERIIKSGLSPFSSVDERSASHGVVSRLEEFLDGIRTGSRYSSALSIDEARELLGQNFIGAEAYLEQLGVAVAAPPPLPASISRKLLEARDPFLAGQQLSVSDTHLLAYIAPEISGHPLTVSSLGRLAEHLTKSGGCAPVARWSSWYDYEPFAHERAFEGSWALLPKFTMPRSTQRSLEAQRILLRRYPGYEVANARELVVAHTLNFLTNGERLFREFGRCRNETFDKQIVGVGFASEWGFVIDRAPPRDARPHLGLAMSRKLYLAR